MIEKPRAVITGASSGLGKCLNKSFSENYNNINRNYLNDALMTSIAGISAAIKNTG